MTARVDVQDTQSAEAKCCDAERIRMYVRIKQVSETWETVLVSQL